ncbi:YlmC/YmxH family sporulation protein [Cerasibacillus terrae]|uniref:YlmC/YmxH family sporulation protein n=1 Tax=Cerasibacillus terrae TaxID=2498845 RepID=A0A5C8P1Z4_9BACI|nr:YlmC/YmxH family sporulation protein [Cerasibacillus terrae]TXL67605.1 YlmC/YmxH family sporulation protein [Cerasibacillus terrae]
MITLSELQLKEVITINNGKRLGHLSDLEIDPHYGNILAIIIYLRDGNAFFGKQEELIIYWEQIITIGDDVILIEEREDSTVYQHDNI